jgi:tRNA/rRNA methyltransferase
VLVGTRNPLNMGAAARAMSNFGFHDLRVVRPYEVAFREARSAVGAAALLRSAEEHKTLAEAVADCTLVVGTTAIGRRQLKQPVKRLEAGAKHIRKKLQSSRVAILFGSEKVGLSNTDLSHCNFLIHVPTRKEHLSMNLGQSVAVCLYELSRSALPEAIAGKPEAIKAGDLERVTQLVLEAATASGYVNDRSRPAIEQRVRRLLRRMRVPAEDTGLVLGILRQILWKLNQ